MTNGKQIAWTGLLLAASAASSASAAIILSDDFDGYAGQAAFEAAWPAIGTLAPTSGALSAAQASSAPNSIHNPGTAGNNQSRNRRSFADTPSLIVESSLVWSFDFYDSSPFTTPQRNYANLQDTTAPSGANQLVSMGLNSNQNGADSGGQFYMARVFGYTPLIAPDPHGGPNEGGTLGANAYFKLNDFGAGARTEGWHNLKVIISTDDGASTDYDFYVDGVLAERVANIGTPASIRQYDNIAIGSGLSNGVTEVFFDNMQLEFNAAPILGDFDGDFDVDLTDYLTLSTHLFSDVSALTTEQAYLLGDMTTDLVINASDLRAFRFAHDDANGLGAFVAMLAAVPEPSCLGLALLVSAGVAARSRRRSH